MLCGSAFLRVRQPDPSFVQLDLPCFIQASYGSFEGILTQSELFCNDLRRSLVIKRQLAAALFQRGSSPEATELAGIADTILDRAEAGDELGLWRAVLQKERLSRDDCTLLLDLLAQRLIDRAEREGSTPALARLSGLVSEMQALVSRNVSPAHVLGLFSRLFAG